MKRTDRYYGYISVDSEEVKISLHSTSVDGALGKLQTLYPQGFRIVHIQRIGIEYPELNGIEVAPKVTVKKTLPAELMSGFADAYEKKKVVD